MTLPWNLNNMFVMPEIEPSANNRDVTNKSKSSSNNKSKVTTLIEQSSKVYMENKIIHHIGEGNFDTSQARMRDNIHLKLKSQVSLIPDEESAISELDEAIIDEELDYALGPQPFGRGSSQSVQN